MKVEGWLFTGAAGFYAVIAVIYSKMTGDVIGTTALALTAGLTIIIGTYTLFTGKRVGIRPEDRLDAEIADADADYGFFSPHSWWPLPVGLFTGVIMWGVVFAAWLVVVGVVGLLISVTGWLFEYYRGDFAH